jgi:CTP:molybdopterin cytidylyltransferase MocA
MAESVCGLVLAAGMGSRMGGRKLELTIEGVSLLARVVRACLGSRLGPIVLVFSPQTAGAVETLAPYRNDERLRFIGNPWPESGMGKSLRLGMEHVPHSAAGVMILLADQPFITAEVIEMLTARFDLQPASIICAAVRGVRTTPVIFPSRLFGELARVQGDKGGREVIHRHAADVELVECGDRFDNRDIDTPEEARVLCDRDVNQTPT